MFSSSFNCRIPFFPPPPSSNDNQLHSINLIRSLVRVEFLSPRKFSDLQILPTTHRRGKITTKYGQRFRTIFDTRRVETILDRILDNHVPSLDECSRERERERKKEKRGGREGRKKWTQVQINLIPWKQRIEWYVRSRLRENPVTIVTRFAKCVLSLSRALTPVIDEYKANILRPRKLGNGRKGAAWRASPNGKFSEENKEREILQFPFFSLSLSRDWTRSTKRSD